MGAIINDISNPHDVRFVDNINEEDNYTKSVQSSDNKLYIYRNGLNIYDLSSIPEIRFLGDYGSSFHSSHFRVEANSGFVYITSEYRLLSVLDIRIPAYPNNIAYIGESFESYYISFREEIVFIASGNNGIKIVDVSDPYEPVEIGSCDTYGMARSIGINDDYAYIGECFDGIRIFDISDLNNPYTVGNFWADDSIYSIEANDNYVFFANNNNGLRVIDISDPSAPFEVGYFKTPTRALNVSIHGNIAYVTDYECGILQLDISHFNEESISEPSPPLDQIQSTPQDFTLTSYPNPFNSTLNITLPPNASSIEIADINGKTVHSANITSQTSYSWSPSDGMASGVYKVKVKTNETEITSKVVYIK